MYKHRIVSHDERAPCGFGAFGHCCCGCRFQAVIRLGFAKRAPASDGVLGEIANAATDTYGCTYFHMHEQKNPIVVIDQHGACEGWDRRSEAIAVKPHPISDYMPWRGPRIE